MKQMAESQYKYDALVVLGAVMEWDAEKRRWVFPTIVERYAGKLVMGTERALAAKEIEKDAAVVLVTGGSDTHPETGEKVSRAVELSRLMVEDLGIPAQKVHPMGQMASSHTLGNAEDLAQYLTSHMDALHTHTIAILCPFFQLKRAQLMFDQHPFFKEHTIKLEWIVVEDVLEAKDPRYTQWRKDLYNSPEAEINRQMEARGIEALKSGEYQPKS